MCFVIRRNKPKIKIKGGLKTYRRICPHFISEKQTQNARFIVFFFAIRPFTKHLRHQTDTGTCNIPPPGGTTIQMFYLFIFLNNLRILVSVMLANRRIARPLFSCLDLLQIMTSPCFEVAKVFLRHRQQSLNNL